MDKKEHAYIHSRAFIILLAFMDFLVCLVILISLLRKLDGTLLVKIFYYVFWCILSVFIKIIFLRALEIAEFSKEGIKIKTLFKHIKTIKWKDIVEIKEKKLNVSSRNGQKERFYILKTKEEEPGFVEFNRLKKSYTIIYANDKTRKLIEKYSGKFDEYHPLSNFKGKTRIR